MGKYENLAKEIVGNIGGKENVLSLTHCVTRLRFVLKDESKAQDDALKKMEGVVTVMKSGGQYQVVIGSHVPEVYADVIALTGMEEGTGRKNQRKSGRSFYRYGIWNLSADSWGFVCMWYAERFKQFVFLYGAVCGKQRDLSVP